MLDALCLQHLLNQLAGDNLSLYFRDYTDHALDGKSQRWFLIKRTEFSKHLFFLWLSVC